MTSQGLTDILHQCLKLDELSYQLYSKMTAVSALRQIKLFWGKMAQEEKGHVLFWKRTLTYSQQNTIPDIFDDTQDVLSHLCKSYEKAQNLLSEIDTERDVSKFFITAYWMEFYLLYPAFNTLFHYIGLLSEEKNAEPDYEQHLMTFVEGFRQFAVMTPEMELLGTLLSNLWKRNQELVLNNMYDGLTQVLNRKGLYDLMTPYASLAQRNEYPIAILMFDIDNFKKTNDTYGHQAGDAILREVAQKIRKALRPSDLIGRYGGEEFIVFASNCNTDAAKTLAEKLNHLIADQPINNIQITISIGAVAGKVTSNNIIGALEKYVSLADKELYNAKQKGKNCAMIHGA